MYADTAGTLSLRFTRSGTKLEAAMYCGLYLAKDRRVHSTCLYQVHSRKLHIEINIFCIEIADK